MEEGMRNIKEKKKNLKARNDERRLQCFSRVAMGVRDL